MLILELNCSILLLTAEASGNLEFTQILLDHGADVHADQDLYPKRASKMGKIRLLITYFKHIQKTNPSWFEANLEDPDLGPFIREFGFSAANTTLKSDPVPNEAAITP